LPFIEAEIKGFTDQITIEVPSE